MDAEPVGDIISRFLQQSGLVRRSRSAEIERRLVEALGPAAEHVRLDAIRDDVVTLAVDSAPLLAELRNFRKAELLAALSDDAAGLLVRDIKFRPGRAKR